VLVKDLTGKAGFPEGQFVRIAVRDREDDDYFLERFALAAKECTRGKARA